MILRGLIILLATFFVSFFTTPNFDIPDRLLVTLVLGAPVWLAVEFAILYMWDGKHDRR